MNHLEQNQPAADINQAEQNQPAAESDQASGQTEVLIRLGPNAQMPFYASAGSAGCDLFLAGDRVLLPGMSCLLPLDFVIALEPGIEAQIRPRSGLSLKTSLRLPNSPGTIDSDYRHEVGVLMQNTASLFSLFDQLLGQPELWTELSARYRQSTGAEYWRDRHGPHSSCPAGLSDLPLFLDRQGNPYGTIYLKKGERVAQMVFSRVMRARFTEHESPQSIGANRGGGFGSTGLTRPEHPG